MAFLEDPRLRQRWNQITHDAEAATENAAAGIWTFQHNYINPCFGSIRDSIDHCTTACLGDPEDRIRRQRERARERADYSFNFYDDWDREEESGGLFGNWGGEDWDRLLAGSGSQKRHTGGETTEQPRRKRGMSYGTRGATRRKTSEHDPTIIPSTQPLGFLSKFPWKMGGTLRYKPSAADLQEHPGVRSHDNAEAEPLLGSPDSSDYGELRVSRKRSGTTGSGDTSDSYRSRGDLFPSDGEGDEDAIPLDDDITYDMVRKDDRSSGKSGRARSSKGKRPSNGFSGSRTVSRTTLGSMASRESPMPGRRRSSSLPLTPDAESLPPFQYLEMHDEVLDHEEDEELTRGNMSTAQLAPTHMDLQADGLAWRPLLEPELKPTVSEDESYPETAVEMCSRRQVVGHHSDQLKAPGDDGKRRPSITEPPDQEDFIPARLPNFG